MDLTKMKMSLGLYEKIMQVAREQKRKLRDEKKSTQMAKYTRLLNAMHMMPRSHCTGKHKGRTDRNADAYWRRIDDIVYDYTDISPKTGKVTQTHHKINPRSVYELSVDEIKRHLIDMPNFAKTGIKIFDEILHEIVEKDKSWI